MPRILVLFLVAGILLGSQAQSAPQTSTSPTERLDWVALSPDSLQQTSYHFQHSGKPPTRTGSVVLERLQDGKISKSSLTLEEAAVSDLLETIGTPSLLGLRFQHNRNCESSVRWDIIQDSQHQKISTVCGETVDGLRIARLSRAIQVLFNP
jgi:hypothetical protein